MAKKILNNPTDSAWIINEILKKDKISVSELARRVGLSRQTVNDSMSTNMSLAKFLNYLDALGYGITIRPKTAGLGMVDMADKDMCEKCLYKKLADIVDEIREKSAEMVTSKAENPETEIE